MSERSPAEVQKARASISAIVRGMEAGPEPETAEEVGARVADSLTPKPASPTAEGLTLAERKQIRQQSLRRALEADSVNAGLSEAARDEAKRLLAMLPPATS
jgi:hypothetical protein